MKWIWFIITGVIIILGLVYFFSSQKTSSSKPTAGANQETDVITIANFSFDPAQLTIPQATAVTFANNDSVDHTVTGDDFDSGAIAPGSSFTHTFSQKGSFNYHCSIHPSMRGVIIVK